jgi:predicted transcriptional regulator
LTSCYKQTVTKRRDKIGIMAEILEISRNGILKTQIMYKANLSFAQLSEYLRFMLKTQLLNKFNANGKDVYGATKKGKDFLLRYSNLKELIEEDNSKNQVKLPPSNLLK